MGVIFISHSSKNNAKAVEVRDWLRGEGYAQTFLDLDPEHGLAPGQRWEEELHKAGERCLAVVVLISPAWCASKWCFHEFKFAKALGKRIFPVLIDPTPFSDIPFELTSHFQMADISTPERHDDGLTRLRFGLQRAGLDPTHFILPEDRPPYRGLSALEEDDAAIFFGRDAQITAGLDALRQMRGGAVQRVLTIAAASGAGKSSFLRAGLLARLLRDEENFLVLPLWRPARDALGGETGLATSLGAGLPGPARHALETRQGEVVARFQSMADAAGETWRGDPPTLVLPLDQAEELFSADNATAPAAIDLLIEVLDQVPDLLVLATIRSDALAHLQSHQRLAEQLRLFNLPALPPSAFREVIEGPARLATPPIQIEPELTDRLIADLDKADALPLLAFTLQRLVARHDAAHRVGVQDYESGLGGIRGAIQSAVEVALRKANADPALGGPQHELDSLARSAFIPWLVQVDEVDARPRRRVARWSELPSDTHALVQHFVDERLLVSQDLSGQTVIEVSHEAVLRHWLALAAWINEERLVLEGLHRVIRSAHEWENSSKALTPRSPELLVHRGERLRTAETYLQRPDIAAALAGIPIAYLRACRVQEDQEEAARAEQAQRERRHQRRTALWQTTASIILLGGFIAGSAVGWSLIKAQRNINHQQSPALALMGMQLLAQGDHVRATLLALLAARENALSPSSAEGQALFASAAQTILHRVSIHHEPEIEGVTFSNDGTLILTWGADGAVRLWDTETEQQIGPSLIHPSPIVGATFSNDDARILTWGDDHAAKLWDAATGQPIKPEFQHGDQVQGAAFSRDDARVLTWGKDGTARLWDTETGRPIGRGLSHDGPILGAILSQDETQVLTWSEDGTARLWDTQTGKRLGPDLQHEHRVEGAHFIGDGSRVLTWSLFGPARLWDAHTRTQLGTGIRHGRMIYGAAPSADGARIVTHGPDNTARLWDTQTGRQVGADLKHEDAVWSAVFFQGDQRILTGSNDHTARIWDANTGRQVAPTLPHGGKVHRALLSRDETRILTWSDDNTIRLWGERAGKQMGANRTHRGPVRGAVFFQDDQRVLTWGDDHTARTWDAATGQQRGPIISHEGQVRGALLSRDETRILTWSHDNTGKLWDAETGQQLGQDIRPSESPR